MGFMLYLCKLWHALAQDDLHRLIWAQGIESKQAWQFATNF